MTRTPMTPWFRKRRGPRVSRQLAQAALTDAMGAVQENRSDEAAVPQPFADQCERVTTPAGRKAHLRHPELGILCGWPVPSWTDAGDSLPTCLMCAGELERLSGHEAAS